ncbi:MAG: lactate utilization protein [Candidatus Helarchaeota archaeon]|nr:lactate utilization protein [Candidatus Helarchaeota archaeon]
MVELDKKRMEWFPQGEKKYNELIVQRAIEALKKHHFKVKFFPTKEEAVEWLMSKIPADSTVGVGGSYTLIQTGIIEKLSNRTDITFYNRWKLGIDGKEERNTRYQNLSADIFITGSNALTLDGKLVNVDGMGNRIAAMIFGPKKVFFVVGKNKIVKDVDAAIQRIHNLTAPKNAARYSMDLPCTRTGLCAWEECNEPQRICNFTLIIERPFNTRRMNIILIGEDLGF